MSSNPLVDLLDQATALIAEARAMALGSVVVPAGASLQAALDAAAPSATLLLEAANYPGSLVITKPVTLISQVVFPLQRVSPASVGTWIVGTDDAITVQADGVSLVGIGVYTANPQAQLVGVTWGRFGMDRCALLGGPQGQHRGLMLNGDTATITRSYVDGCWLAGREAQAIAGWDGTKAVQIDDCYLAGASQSVLFGGADSANPDRIPSTITITRSTLTKNPAWFTNGALVKTALELKSAIGVTVQDCVLEYAGTKTGQGAYPIVLTVRNQDGTAPWSTIQNVLIERCLARYGGAGINILGTDNVNPSGRMSNVTIRNVAMTDLDPTGLTGGAGRLVQIDGAPDGVTLDSLTFQGNNIASGIYVIPPAPTHLTLRNIAFPQTQWGSIKIDAGGSGVAALQQLCPDAVIALSSSDTGASGYPTA